MPALEQVAGEVSRAIRPHLDEEDFVTAALAQITPAGELTVVNCGHHPPPLCHRGKLRPLSGGPTALPIGLDDDFTGFTASWSPGDRLLLYTDGLVEAVISTETSSRKTRSQRRLRQLTATGHWTRC